MTTQQNETAPTNAASGGKVSGPTEAGAASKLPLMFLGAVVAVIAAALALGAGTDDPATASAPVGVTTKAASTTTPQATDAAATSAAQPSRGSTSGAVTQTAAAATPSTTATTDRVAVEAIVRSYILENPEILLEAQQALEIKMRAEQEERQRVAVLENAPRIFRSKDDPVFGNPDGDVTVVEFFDYNCGFCKRAIPHLAKLVESDKNVKVVFKEFPIFGEASEQAALAALAAREQGKYWEMHRALLELPGRANRETALAAGKDLGLDIERMKKDMESDALRQVISDVQRLATEMGIQGTPHFLVGPQAIPGAPDDLYEQISTRVAQLRKDGCTVC
ncbi:MAG: DsbA family protein [Pseudomonadota bacterium]